MLIIARIACGCGLDDHKLCILHYPWKISHDLKLFWSLVLIWHWIKVGFSRYTFSLKRGVRGPICPLLLQAGLIVWGCASVPPKEIFPIIPHHKDLLSVFPTYWKSYNHTNQQSQTKLHNSLRVGYIKQCVFYLYIFDLDILDIWGHFLKFGFF